MYVAMLYFVVTEAIVLCLIHGGKISRLRSNRRARISSPTFEKNQISGQSCQAPGSRSCYGIFQNLGGRLPIFANITQPFAHLI